MERLAEIERLTKELEEILKPVEPITLPEDD